MDVVVVGAGPIGLETAWGLQRAGLSVVVLERGVIGSTMRWWAPGTKFFSGPDRIAIAGVPMAVANQEKATREDYLGYLTQVAQMHRINVRTRVSVDDVRGEVGGFEVVTSDSRSGQRLATLSAQRVVLAIGNMHRPRLIGIPGEGLPHVSHYLRDPLEYVGRRVVIVGGKNSAVEAAIRLCRAGAEVTLSYRRDAFDARRVKYWLRPELEWLIEHGRIAFLPETHPVEVLAEGVVVEGRDAVRRLVEADDVLLLTGYAQDGSLFERVGITLKGEAQHPEFSLKTMESNVPGVYVAGTAIAGTEQGGVRVFIENAHAHATRIVEAITGRAVSGMAPASGGESYGKAEES